MVLLQPKITKPDGQPNKAAPASTSPMEQFWGFFLVAILIGAVFAYYNDSFLAFTSTLTAFMLVYCALCLAEIVKELRK